MRYDVTSKQILQYLSRALHQQSVTTILPLAERFASPLSPSPSSGFGEPRAAQCGTAGFFPAEVAHSSTRAEPSTDAFAVGAMLAIVALKAAHREANAFAHEVSELTRADAWFRESERLCLCASSEAFS